MIVSPLRVFQLQRAARPGKYHIRAVTLRQELAVAGVFLSVPPVVVAMFAIEETAAAQVQAIVVAHTSAAEMQAVVMPDMAAAYVASAIVAILRQRRRGQ